MDARELRIGNLIQHNGNWSYRSHSAPKVIEWTYSDWFAVGESRMSLEDISPIPLTEEWLVKFGFRKESEWKYRFPIEGEITIDTERFIVTTNGIIISICPTVHQLQNLYFTLTGKELELKK